MKEITALIIHQLRCDFALFAPKSVIFAPSFAPKIKAQTTYFRDFLIVGGKKGKNFLLYI